MANSRFRDLTESEFIKELNDYRDEQQELIEAECLGFAYDEEAIKERREKVQNDFRFFAKTYFPHYLKTDSESEFQKYAFNNLPKIIDAPRGKKEILIAPRGESKTTIATTIFNLWAIITERKKFPLIISDTFEQAAAFLEDIKVELEFNPRLSMDYPECTGKGKRWKIGKIITKNDVMVVAAGIRQKLRGIKRGPDRPDLIIPDDLENDENVEDKEQRDKLERIITRSVMKLGPPDGSVDIIWVGTLLHYDAVLNRFRKKPSWHCHKVFKAIIKMPDKMDLWDKFEEIYDNESQGEEEADKFYYKNKAKMDKGAIVSWPEVRPLLLLMKIRADDLDAFNTEMQNMPSAKEFALFKDLHYWVHRCRHWVFFGSIDPSLGKNKKSKKGDPSAILVGGFDREHGILDLIVADIERRQPLLIIDRTILYQQTHSCALWGVETVQFQEFLRTQLIELSIQRKCPVPAKGLTNNTDKELRIQSIEPYVSLGKIRFNKYQTTMIEQLEYYGEVAHDDGPDALEMLWRIATKFSSGSVRITKPSKQTFRQKFKTNFSGY